MSEFYDIDMHALDREWLGFPKLFHQTADLLPLARKDHGEAKAAFELAEAELKLEVRKSPESFGLEKATEASVSEAVTVHKKYKRAQQKVIEAKHAVEVLEVARETLMEKRRSLENLVQLWLADYFAEPRAKGASGKKVEEMERKTAFRKTKRKRDKP